MPNKQGMVVTCNPNNWEAEEGETLSTWYVWVQFGLHESQNNDKAEKMAHQVKVSATKPNNLILSPHTHMVEGMK